MKPVVKAITSNKKDDNRVLVKLDVELPPGTEFVPNVQIDLLADTSGSMNGDKLATLVEVFKASVTAVQKLSGSSINLTEFNTDIVTTNGADEILKRIPNIVATGGTDIGKALTAAKNPFVILATDGHPSQGTASTIQMLKACLSDNVSLFCIGIGYNHNSTLLSELGKYFFANDLSDIQTIVAEIISEIIDSPIRNVVARLDQTINVQYGGKVNEHGDLNIGSLVLGSTTYCLLENNDNLQSLNMQLSYVTDQVCSMSEIIPIQKASTDDQILIDDIIQVSILSNTRCEVKEIISKYGKKEEALAIIEETEKKLAAFQVKQEYKDELEQIKQMIEDMEDIDGYAVPPPPMHNLSDIRGVSQLTLGSRGMSVAASTAYEEISASQQGYLPTPKRHRTDTPMPSMPTIPQTAPLPAFVGMPPAGGFPTLQRSKSIRPPFESDGKE